MFNTLPEEEKKYWHSHQYEVSVSGISRQTSAGGSQPHA